LEIPKGCLDGLRIWHVSPSFSVIVRLGGAARRRCDRDHKKCGLGAWEGPMPLIMHEWALDMVIGID